MKAINTTLFQNTSKNGFLKAEPKGDTFLGFKKPNQIIYSLYSDNNWVCDFIAEIGSNINFEKEYKENRKLSNEIHQMEKTIKLYYYDFIKQYYRTNFFSSNTREIYIFY